MPNYSFDLDFAVHWTLNFDSVSEAWDPMDTCSCLSGLSWILKFCSCEKELETNKICQI